MQPPSEWLAQPGGLAERLERMRKAAGLTGDQLRELLGGWPRSKVSKLENGRQMPSEADITAWAAACGQPADELLDMLSDAQAVHRRYRHQIRRGHAAIQDDMDRLVRGAKHIRNFEVTLIPGLLQTADYARYRALEAVRLKGFAEEGIEEAVTARLRRQDVLYDSSRTFEFVITEAALRFRLCPPDVMLGQIDRLLNLSGLPHITLAIIPFDAELAVAPQHGFLMLDDLTYVEMQASDDFLPPRESSEYEKAADGLLAEAVTGDEMRALLRLAAEKLRERP